MATGGEDIARSLRSTPGKKNFQRAARLVFSGGTLLIREVFDQLLPPGNLLTLLASMETKLKKPGSFTKVQQDHMYPAPGVFGTSRDFDITLLYRLLKEFGRVVPPAATGWSQPPDPSDETFEADLVRIKIFRNRLCHNKGDMELSDEEFKKVWKEISECMVRIAGSISHGKATQWSREICRYEDAPLTPEDERNTEELKQWYLSDMQTKESLCDIQEDVRRIGDGMNEYLTRLDRLQVVSPRTEPETAGSREADDAVQSTSTADQEINEIMDINIDVANTVPIGGNAPPSDPIPSHDELMRDIADRYLKNVNPSTQEQFNAFQNLLEKTLGVFIKAQRISSLTITVKCTTLESLEALWDSYKSGQLNAMAEKYLVTGDILRQYNLTSIGLKTTMNVDSYWRCQKELLLPEEKNIERLPFPERHLMGHVIGKGGSTIRGIRTETGASIYTTEEGFSIKGTPEQRAEAKLRIEQVMETSVTNIADEPEMIDYVPEDLKGLVIGKRRATLKRICSQTGAYLYIYEGNLYLKGSFSSRSHAHVLIKHVIAGAISREDRLHMKRCYIDHWNVRTQSDLQMDEIRNPVVSAPVASKEKFRLSVIERIEELEETPTSVTEPRYLAKLRKDVCDLLRLIKDKISEQEATDSGFIVEMWSHFGQVLIRNMQEDESSRTWKIEEVEKKLEEPYNTTASSVNWSTEFMGGLRCDTGRLKESLGEDIISVSDKRFDLNFYTPTAQHLKCKIWLSEKELETGKKHKAAKRQVEQPRDYYTHKGITNIIEELHFKDKNMDELAKGWLCLPIKQALRADIMMPACRFDYRLRLATSVQFCPDSLRNKEEESVLAHYLSRIKLNPDDKEIDLPEEMPKGFHLIHKRSCYRTTFVHLIEDTSFRIEVSEENTWISDGSEELQRSSTDLHLHCNDWERAFESGTWEPEEIADKLPQFLHFTRRVQKHLSQAYGETY